MTATSTYDSVCATREITQLGCWAHARRRFYQAYENVEEGAAHYLLLIRELYGIEAKMKPGASVDQVVAQRREKSQPVLQQIAQSLEQDAQRYLAKTAMADATGYALVTMV